MVSFALLSFLTYALLTAAQNCSPSNRCENGCCNTNGWCGFGPDYCGDTCVGDCDRKSECNPGYGPKWAEHDKCPLNVCCSKAGYCGTTKDFCGNKTVSHKTCSKSNGNSRIIGYYEGWASNRPCNVFWPEQIPVGLYTHINFAFATIDPKTFKVGPSSQNDVGLFKRLLLVKEKDPDLKVFIAIGGWTFNDPGPTATTFSDLAASVPRQKAFIESLLSFMSTYGFDGVDLDWEYPAADDRSGRAVDFDNFPKFLSRLRDSLSSAHKGISITLPASYWYLQHFDLKALAKSVDWFNVMSYDLHGTWDKGNKWTGNFLNAHTNLTEINDALDLIWRNDIDPGKVVMGLGFYGRSFTATSSSCLSPGCTFESGGDKGKCSREVGILLDSEIDDLVKEHSVSPKFFKKEAVKVATWENQWVAYDDEDTFKLKSEFAQSLCLGGLMVWAISHDTKDAKYNKALAKVANRKITSLPMTDGSDNPYEYVDYPNPQCKWTNCAETCPSGWVAMPRSDSGARNGELMLDESACAGTGVHTFCCPTNDKLPTCGWYTHHNGKCDQTCPQDTVEIGSNDKYCHQNYQAACCTTNSKSMRLYTKCEWGQYPMCNAQTGCPGTDQSKKTLLALSSGGTGGGSCNMWKFGNGVFEVQQRKFCCDTSDTKTTFSDCEWYNNFGFGPSGAPEKFCRSGCPNDRVRVSIDQWSTDCYVGGGGGGKARCCVPSYSTTVELENPKLDAWRYDMRDFMDNPTCANPGPVLDATSSGKLVTRSIWDKRAVWNPLQKRSGENPRIIAVEGLLLAQIAKVGTSAMLEAMRKIWDDAVGETFPNLKISQLRDFITGQPNYGSEGPIQLAHSVVCSPHYWNFLAGGGGKKTLNCIDGLCTTESCDDLDRRSEDGTLSRLHAGISFPNEDAVRHHLKLDKRTFRAARSYHPSMTSPDGSSSVQVTITLPRYHGSEDYAPDDPIFDEAVDFASRGDCTNSRIAHFVLVDGERYQIEHVFDGNVVAQFMEDAAAGRLRSGATARTGPVAISFFRVAQMMPLLPGAPPLPGGGNFPGLYERVMECLGSEFNMATLVLAHKDINKIKTSLMQGHDPIARTRLPTVCSDFAHPEYVLLRIRASIGLIRYLNYQGTPNINQHLTNIVNNAGLQWAHGERSYNQANPSHPVAVYAFWREWTRDFFSNWLISHTTDFCREAIRQMRNYWGVGTNEITTEVLEILREQEDELNNLSIDIRSFN